MDCGQLKSNFNKKLLKVTALVVIGAFLINVVFVDLVWAYSGSQADSYLRQSATRVNDRLQREIVGTIINGFSKEELREWIEKHGSIIEDETAKKEFHKEFEIISSMLTKERKNGLFKLAEKLGIEKEEMSNRIKQARDDLLENGKILKQFPDLVQSSNKYGLGLGTEEYLSYVSGMLEHLKDKPDLRAEYLLHEALCYHFQELKGKEGHQIARQIQKILFPQNYENVVPVKGDSHPELAGKLTLELREFIDVKVQHVTSRVEDDKGSQVMSAVVKGSNSPGGNPVIEQKDEISKGKKKPDIISHTIGWGLIHLTGWILMLFPRVYLDITGFIPFNSLLLYFGMSTIGVVAVVISLAKFLFTPWPRKEVCVKGVTTFDGKVSGIVRLIKDASKKDKIFIGDILVTAKTNKNMLPAMKRAGAIITEEEDFYAKSVAEERGIPYLIGANEATKHLRQGEVVTVDGKNRTVATRRKVEEEKRDPFSLRKELTQMLQDAEIEVVGLEKISPEKIESIINLFKIIPKEHLAILKKMRFQSTVWEGVTIMGVSTITVLPTGVLESFNDCFLHELAHILDSKEGGKDFLLGKPKDLSRQFYEFEWQSLRIPGFLATVLPIVSISVVGALLGIPMLYISLSQATYILMSVLGPVPIFLGEYLRISPGFLNIWIRKSSGPSRFVTKYATADPREHFAETYTKYIIHGDSFRRAAIDSESLREQYNFVKEHYFFGTEYTLDKNGFVIKKDEQIKAEVTRRYANFKSSMKVLRLEKQAQKQYSDNLRALGDAVAAQKFPVSQTLILYSEPLLEYGGGVDFQNALEILLKNNALDKVVLYAEDPVYNEILERLIEEVKKKTKTELIIETVTKGELGLEDNVTEVEEIEAIIGEEKNVLCVIKGTVEAQNRVQLRRFVKDRNIPILVFKGADGKHIYSFAGALEHSILADEGIIDLLSLETENVQEEYKEHKRALRELSGA
ncbi:MAG: PEP-utilizing enzyme [Candidatus Ratteibacteria bacterium]|nr:PEP-utilizing enzyme [Candidatus Ratteibacteria bacterium]